jgi:hypothetical protein
LEFFRLFQFFSAQNCIFLNQKLKKKDVFFLSIFANDLNFGVKRTKLSTLKTLIFANCRGPEVVQSSWYQQNIVPEFTHLYIQCGPSMMS